MTCLVVLLLGFASSCSDNRIDASIGDLQRVRSDIDPEGAALERCALEILQLSNRNKDTVASDDGSTADRLLAEGWRHYDLSPIKSSTFVMAESLRPLLNLTKNYQRLCLTENRIGSALAGYDRLCTELNRRNAALLWAGAAGEQARLLQMTGNTEAAQVLVRAIRTRIDTLLGLPDPPTVDAVGGPGLAIILLTAMAAEYGTSIPGAIGPERIRRDVKLANSLLGRYGYMLDKSFTELAACPGEFLIVANQADDIITSYWELYEPFVRHALAAGDLELAKACANKAVRSLELIRTLPLAASHHLSGAFFAQHRFNWPELKDHWATALQDAMLAEISLATKDGRTALGYVRTAAQHCRELDVAYAPFSARRRVSDGLAMMTLDVGFIEAQALESSGDLTAATGAYDQLCVIGESIRSGLPVTARLRFFESRMRTAFLGAIRTRALRAEVSPTPAALDELLTVSEHMRARHLREQLGEDTAIAQLAEQPAPFRHGVRCLIALDLGSIAVSIYCDERDGKRLQIDHDGHGLAVIAKRFRDACANQIPFLASDMSRLWRFLAADAADPEAVAARRVYFVLDGAYAWVPVAALNDEQGRLAHASIIPIVLPSLAVTAQKHRESGRGILAVVDPVIETDPAGGTTSEMAAGITLATRGTKRMGGLVALPETRLEGATVLASMPSADNRLAAGDQATEAILSSMAGFRVLHFATHGLLAGEWPGLHEPALLLSRSPGNDGMLTASEVMSVKLHADVAVLSACNTASGEAVTGEGLQGMSRAFLAAGCTSVVASLWPVDSATTVQLMQSFYSGLANGLEAPEALHAAEADIAVRQAGGDSQERGLRRISLPQRFAASVGRPYYWAPFVVITTSPR